MPAVDSPEPGSPMPGELISLLSPLIRHPRALGLSLTIYDPAFDPDRSCARRLVSLLEALLAAPYW
jgi:arginase